MHLCEEHARGFLQKEEANPVASIASALAKQLDLGQTKKDLEELDQKACPVWDQLFRVSQYWQIRLSIRLLPLRG